MNLNSPSGDQNLLTVLQGLLSQIILAAKDGRAVMISGIIEGQYVPLDISLVFGVKEGLNRIKPVFLKSNENVLKFADEYPGEEKPKDKKGVEVDIEKTEDGGIKINFNK